MERKKYNPAIGRLPAVAPLANAYVPYQDAETEQYDMRKGLVRGTLYPGLDLPFMGMVNKKNLPASSLSELQAVNFAVQELALYLDTHRDDLEALERYRQYQQMYHEMNKEYTQRHGPMCHKDRTTAKDYAWLSDPWPWEYSANKEG